MTKRSILLMFLTVQISFSVFGQEGEKPEPKFFQLRDSLYMMTFSYPNIAISVGEDGIFLVDANLKNNAQIVFDVIREKFNNVPIKYVVNTHSHVDHTGGNSFLIKKGVVCITHENARESMYELYYADEDGRKVDSTKGKPTRDFTEDELPAITFSKKMNLYFNDENIELIHVPDAHTKGDVIVYFKKNNVIALGDNYFGNAYTFGANIEGMIKVYEKVIGIIDDETIIIPGHGVHSNKKELVAYLAMIKDVRSEIEQAIKDGKTLEEVKADASITKKYDEKYGKLYINGERFRDLIYNDSNSGWTE